MKVTLQGDEQMTQDLFIQEIQTHSEMLYRVAYTILRNDDACRDALQDTALKAWEKRATLREPQYFRTWVTRILIHTCYDTQRKQRRVVSLGSVPESAVTPPDPTLALALGELPEKLRLPLVLCYSEGMNYAEIAQALNIPLATVRGRIYRAKNELRKELDAQ